jgi:hypothetical protein
MIVFALFICIHGQCNIYHSAYTPPEDYSTFADCQHNEQLALSFALKVFAPEDVWFECRGKYVEMRDHPAQ